jgi:plasmid maintenance system antidote protein VapI
MSGFVVVPGEMLKSAKLKPWLQKALAHALSLPPKAARTRTGTRAKGTA